MGAVDSVSENVYCVAITFKMTEWVKQLICIKFCIKLEYSSMENIWMIQKAAAIGNWWLAASTRQHAYSCITSCEEFFGETSNHPGDYSLFPKLKSPFKGKRFQISDKIQENTIGQLMAIGRAMWSPKVPTLKGTKASVFYIQCFWLSPSIIVSIFHSMWLDNFWTDLIYYLDYIWINY